MKLDKELEEFRDLMKRPEEFHDGFTWTSLAAAIFIALLMVPGAMYMSLVSGQDPSGSAKWVTVILFLEIARRTHKSLKRSEIFVLFYLCSAAMATPFSGLLWTQFIVQSDAVYGQGWQNEFPIWFAPTDPDILGQRTFMIKEWMPAVGMALLFSILGRLDGRILGYGLFKMASDYEKLPFPMAPVGAMGVLAIEEEGEESSPRWSAFAIGGAIGLLFGFIYLGIPVLSNTIFGVTMQVLPIPFVDWTGKTEGFLPAVATGMSFDLGTFLTGMVMPWWAVVGGFIGLVGTFIANPLLYRGGILTTWQPGDGIVETVYKNTIDFYFSFGIGLSLAVACIGFYSVWQSVRRHKATKELREERLGPPPGRGDIPNWAIILTYLTYVSVYIGLSGWLIDWHRGVMIVLCFYGLVYTPIISYVTARLEGLCGQVVALPLVREIGFILSGYKGLKIWFLPIPLSNYGEDTVFYRQAELTGTRFWSIWKADLLLVPFILLSSILFANFIWSLAPIPSAAYPFAQKMWEFNALNTTLTWGATMDDFSPFYKAINLLYIGIGSLVGLISYAVLAVFGAPILLVYGFIRGMGQSMPHAMILQFLGALLGRFYFQRRWGARWRQTIPIVTAGFGCGMGLIAMFCIGITFLSKAVFQLTY
jgi:hypothetical protein